MHNDDALIPAALNNMISTAVEAAGYVFWGCVIQPQAKKMLLRVYIDKPVGVTIEDCAAASHQINGVLAVNPGLIKDYLLEVSSPGMERRLFKLAHYERYKSHTIKLRLKLPYRGQRNFQGIIENICQDSVLLQGEKEKNTFKFNDIERANLVTDWKADKKGQDYNE